MNNLFKNSILIGFGALGKALYSMLSSRGIFFSHVVYPSASEQSDGLTHFSRTLPEGDDSPSLIVICVPDQQIASIAESLTSHFSNMQSVRVIHTAGSLDRSVLKFLEQRGALTGVWHPMMTFHAGKPYRSLNGTIVSIEADDPLKKELIQLTTLLDGLPVHIPANLKSAYHLTGVLGSNFLFALMDMMNVFIQDLKTVTGNDKLSVRHFVPIMLQTIENFIENPSIESLSGPVKRKDFETIKRHITTLKQHHPELVSFYKECSCYLAQRCRYSPQEMNQLHSIFGEENGFKSESEDNTKNS